jgi:hypothetical protein
MAATVAYIQVTEKVSGDTLTLSEANIISMVGEDSGNDTRIKYLTNNRTISNVLLDDTVAALLTESPRLTPFTLTSDGSTFYLNRDRIKQSFVDGSGSINFVDVEEAAWKQFKFTETPTEVETLINGA